MTARSALPEQALVTAPICLKPTVSEAHRVKGTQIHLYSLHDKTRTQALRIGCCTALTITLFDARLTAIPFVGETRSGRGPCFIASGIGCKFERLRADNEIHCYHHTIVKGGKWLVAGFIVVKECQEALSYGCITFIYVDLRSSGSVPKGHCGHLAIVKEDFLSDQFKIIGIDMAGRALRVTSRGRAHIHKFRHCLGQIVAALFVNPSDDLRGAAFIIAGRAIGLLKDHTIKTPLPRASEAESRSRQVYWSAYSGT